MRTGKLRVQEKATFINDLLAAFPPTPSRVIGLIGSNTRKMCKIMDAWPVKIQPGFCGYFCNLGKSEDCVQLCLADHACCELWYTGFPGILV